MNGRRRCVITSECKFLSSWVSHVFGLPRALSMIVVAHISVPLTGREQRSRGFGSNTRNAWLRCVQEGHRRHSDADPTATASLTKYSEGVFSETNSVTLMALEEFSSCNQQKSPLFTTDLAVSTASPLWWTTSSTESWQTQD